MKGTATERERRSRQIIEILHALIVELTESPAQILIDGNHSLRGESKINRLD